MLSDDGEEAGVSHDVKDDRDASEAETTLSPGTGVFCYWLLSHHVYLSLDSVARHRCVLLLVAKSSCSVTTLPQIDR